MNDRVWIAVLSVLVLLVLKVPHSGAHDGGGGMAVEWMTSIIDNEARKLGGIKTVAEHFKDEFGVDGDLIVELRQKKNSYGQIGAILAMAEGMPGGICTNNLEKISAFLGAQHSAVRWETAAAYLGVDQERFLARFNEVAFRVPLSGHNGEYPNNESP